MRVTVAFVPALAAVAWASVCKPSSQSSVPSATASTTATIASTTDVSDTTTLSVSTTETASTTETTTTTSLDDAVPTNFCLKIVTPGTANIGDHIYLPPMGNNLYFASDTGYPHHDFFNLDTDTGALYLSNSPYTGSQVHLKSAPTPGQTISNVQYSRPPLSADKVPLLCHSPTGRYARGSILKCSAAATPAMGGQEFTQFVAETGNLAPKHLLIATDGAVPDPGYKFDLGIFYDNDCVPELAKR